MTTELKQGSNDWLESRIGKVTASNVGAILGLSPFRTRDDVMRSMVREWNGALSEFSGNVATEYGVMHEPMARADYQLKTGNVVETTGFHTFEDWLGASPDGFVGDFGLVEFKCPYSLRNGGEFKSIDYQPHYYAQIQIQMFVTGKEICHFFQWNRFGFSFESVHFDEEWLEENLYKLRLFYDEYLIERESPHNEKHLRSRHSEIENERLSLFVEEYFILKSEIKAKNEAAEKLMQRIISECGENESQIGLHKLTRVNRKSIQYKNALAELLPSDVDLTPYESVSTFWTLK